MLRRAAGVHRRRGAHARRSASAPTPPIFSVVRSLLLEPLPFRDPDRLVMLWEATANDPDDIYIVSAPNYLDWRRSAKSFEETAIWETLNFNFSGRRRSGARAGPARVGVGVQRCSASPALWAGRSRLKRIAPGHDVGGHQLRSVAAPLSAAVRTSSAPSTRINGRPFEIIGVMPSTFRFVNRETAVWTPIAFNEEDSGRGSHSFQAAARLRPGVTPCCGEGRARRARPVAREAVSRRQSRTKPRRSRR